MYSLDNKAVAKWTPLSTQMSPLFFTTNILAIAILWNLQMRNGHHSHSLIFKITKLTPHHAKFSPMLIAYHSTWAAST